MEGLSGKDLCMLVGGMAALILDHKGHRKGFATRNAQGCTCPSPTPAFYFLAQLKAKFMIPVSKGPQGQREGTPGRGVTITGTHLVHAACTGSVPSQVHTQVLRQAPWMALLCQRQGGGRAWFGDLLEVAQRVWQT